ncbi:hypothetical protein OR263_24840 [Streptomyces sp. NEAU-H22]|nr:hypothetical protein [Streptomyces sp. NEAU-H22]
MVGPAAAAVETRDRPPSDEEPQGSPPSPSGSRRHAATITFAGPDPSLRISQPHAALPAETAAAEPDPLRAALDAVHAAVVTYGEGHPALLAEAVQLRGAAGVTGAGPHM